MTSCWPAEKNLGELIAMSAALLIASQFWYLDEGGTLVLLYLPLLLLMDVPADAPRPPPGRRVSRGTKECACRFLSSQDADPDKPRSGQSREGSWPTPKMLQSWMTFSPRLSARATTSGDSVPGLSQTSPTCLRATWSRTVKPT